MSNRNPSRAGKSSQEKQNLYRIVKGISSSDTTKTESPFEPSNTVSESKAPEKSSKKRPQSFIRKIGNHFKRNSATYITCLIVLVATLVIVPFIGLNREVGEVKVEVKDVRDAVKSELNSLKQQHAKLSEQLTEVLNKITAIKTYLLNKFGAKF